MGPADNTTIPSDMNLWRARCGESRTPGSEGGPEKRTSRKAGTALRSDLYSSADRPNPCDQQPPTAIVTGFALAPFLPILLVAAIPFSRGRWVKARPVDRVAASS
jgi:hypothetical protein